MIEITVIIKGFRGFSRYRDMILRLKTWFVLLVFVPLAGACNDNNFAGSSSGADKTEDSGQGPNCDGGVAGDPEAALLCGARDTRQCVEGDKVNIKWTGPVKDCLGQGKTYNYEEKKCAEMRQSQFECSWDTVKAELEKRSLLTEVLRSDADGGAKLVSCGQSEDGNRIVVQWIKVGDAQNIDCNDGASSHHITTGCYTLYTAKDEQPPEASSRDERSKQVYACMNQL